MRFHLASVLVLVSSPSFAIGQAAWTHLYPAVSPGPRVDGLMGCHEASGDVLLLFGTDPAAWRLQGNVWSPFAGAQPPWRDGSRIVYDSVRQRLVLFGGLTTQPAVLQDTWEWNGTTWLNRTTAGSPPARHSHAMAFDPVRAVTGCSVGSPARA